MDVPIELVLFREERGTRKMASKTLRGQILMYRVLKGVRRSEGVSVCLCETWAREKELRVVCMTVRLSKEDDKKSRNWRLDV